MTININNLVEVSYDSHASQYYTYQLPDTITNDTSILFYFHGGGWKKLQTESVDSQTFRNKIEISCGIKKIYNYYGMVEQTGSIFMECDSGYFHCSR